MWMHGLIFLYVQKYVDVPCQITDMLFLFKINHTFLLSVAIMDGYKVNFKNYYNTVW